MIFCHLIRSVLFHEQRTLVLAIVRAAKLHTYHTFMGSKTSVAIVPDKSGFCQIFVCAPDKQINLRICQIFVNEPDICQISSASSRKKVITARLAVLGLHLPTPGENKKKKGHHFQFCQEFYPKTCDRLLPDFLFSFCQIFFKT